MCLQIEIEIPAHDRGEVERTARAIESTIPLEFALASFSKKSRRARLTISEPDQGCACSLLADDASWEDQFWRLRPEALRWLSEAVRSILQQKRGEIGFSAAWLGPDRHNLQEQPIAAGDLVRTISQGEISPRKRYLVAA